MRNIKFQITHILCKHRNRLNEYLTKNEKMRQIEQSCNSGCLSLRNMSLSIQNIAAAHIEYIFIFQSCQIEYIVIS